MVLGSSALVAQPAVAWNQEGHMIVAQLAYNHLDPTVKARCDELIAYPLNQSSSATNTFVTAASWADDFKTELGTSTWHYIDLPISLDGTSFANFVPPTFDVVQAIKRCIATLQNPGAAQDDQAMSLRYLIHFMGDIQQPLHCSNAFFAGQPNGDAGGNGFRITGTYSNLHSLWDSGGGSLADALPRPLSAASQALLNTRVAAIEAAYPFQSSPGSLPVPMDWAIEARDLAVSVCYSGITRNTAPSSAYLLSARSATAARMALGGKRLADLLNTIFALKVKAFLAENGDFGMSWNAVAGTVYHVQWADDPASLDWNPLADVTALSNSASFREAPVNGRRFYRVVK
jgi:hypothetical protein